MSMFDNNGYRRDSDDFMNDLRSSARFASGVVNNREHNKENKFYNNLSLEIEQGNITDIDGYIQYKLDEEKKLSSKYMKKALPLVVIYFLSIFIYGLGEVFFWIAQVIQAVVFIALIFYVIKLNVSRDRKKYLNNILAQRRQDRMFNQ